MLDSNHSDLQASGHCRSLLPQIKRGQCHLVEKYAFIVNVNTICALLRREYPMARGSAKATPLMATSMCRGWHEQLTMGDLDLSKGWEDTWRLCFHLGHQWCAQVLPAEHMTSAPAAPPWHIHGFSPELGSFSWHCCFRHNPCKAARMS